MTPVSELEDEGKVNKKYSCGKKEGLKLIGRKRVISEVLPEDDITHCYAENHLFLADHCNQLNYPNNF